MRTIYHFQVKPDYWRANAEIKYCHSCKYKFNEVTSIHHCRACGEGFCDDCSDFQRPVPEHGWNTPVRSCKKCHDFYLARGASRVRVCYYSVKFYGFLVKAETEVV